MHNKKIIETSSIENLTTVRKMIKNLSYWNIV